MKMNTNFMLIVYQVLLC